MKVFLVWAQWGQHVMLEGVFVTHVGAERYIIRHKNLRMGMPQYTIEEIEAQE